MFLYKEDTKDGERLVYRLPFELVGSNMYFIPSGDTGIVFDPNENDELISLFEKHGTHQITIVLTHEHYDHTIGVEWLQSKIKTRLFCHKACAEAISTEKGNNPKTLGLLLTIRDAADGGHRLDDFLANAKSYQLQADETFVGESELRAGDVVLKCYSAPGHSPGSALFILGGQCIFTGDSLIQRTPTILRLPGSDKNAFKQITKPFLKSLDKSMTVYPGHEEPFKISDALFL